MADPILLNGYTYDHASIRIRVDGTVEHRIRAMEYGDAVENATHLFGTSRYPIAMTRGQYRPKESSIDYYRAAWDDVVARMGAELLTKQFTIEVERSERGSPFTKDVLLGCRFTSKDHSTSEGGDPLIVKAGFLYMVLRTNGQNPLPDMRL